MGIQLKNKKTDNRQYFHQFKSKILLQTIFMILVSVLSVYLLYALFLKGNFANWMVQIFQYIFNLNYDSAVYFYDRTIRNYQELIFIVAMVFVFFVIFRIYINGFIHYFMEISNSVDLLIKENTDDIVLSPELLMIEKKMNNVKHILEKQKMDVTLAEQNKNDLIVYLAHDLKTPLASVIGYLNLLYNEEQISPKLQKKYLGITLNKAERLEDLINEFFEIARFNLSNITLQYSRINLTRLLEQLVYEFNPILKEKNLSCTLNVPNDIMLTCDANKIQRVFDNLLRNAYFYSFDNSNILITVLECNERLIIRFTNHGYTIPKEKLVQIFEQFYRLDSARSTNNGGAGLGLAIAKKIVELHHGTIFARSENEIIEFEVSLPNV